LLRQTCCLPVAATTEFLAPDTKLIELLKGQPPEQGRVAR
jgi:hypothetical protein